MLLHIAHVAFLWSFGELTSSIESIFHKQRGVMGKHVTHTPLQINGWNIIMEVWKIIVLSKLMICRFHVYLPGCNLTGKCGNPLLVFRR